LTFLYIRVLLTDRIYITSSHGKLVYAQFHTGKILPKPANRRLISLLTIKYSVFVHAPLSETGRIAKYIVFPRLNVQ
jgi:hypothetical protein